MVLTFNNQTLVACFFYFCFSLFLAYLFKRSNLFFKVVLFIPFISVFAVLEGANRLELSLAAIAGILVMFFDSILDFLYGIKLSLENFFEGLFLMIRRILQFIFFPIADFFTWFYNLLSRTFGWNRVFHKLGRPRETINTGYQAPKHHCESPRKEAKRKPDPSKGREQRHDTKSKDKPRDTSHRQHRQEDYHQQRNHKPGQSQASGSPKQEPRDDKKATTSRPSEAPNKKASAEEQARQEAIHRAKEEVKRAREQAKQKEQQQDDQGGGGRSYQQILGLNGRYSLADLIKAYKALASRYHPDKYSHMSPQFQQEAQAEFVKVKHAFDELRKEFK